MQLPESCLKELGGVRASSPLEVTYVNTSPSVRPIPPDIHPAGPLHVRPRLSARSKHPSNRTENLPLQPTHQPITASFFCVLNTPSSYPYFPLPSSPLPLLPYNTLRKMMYNKALPSSRAIARQVLLAQRSSRSSSAVSSRWMATAAAATPSTASSSKLSVPLDNVSEGGLGVSGERERTERERGKVGMGGLRWKAAYVKEER